MNSANKILVIDSKKILSQLRVLAPAHRDASTGELNHTALVEDWDRAHGTGSETLNSAHPAWDLALEVR